MKTVRRQLHSQSGHWGAGPKLAAIRRIPAAQQGNVLNGCFLTLRIRTATHCGHSGFFEADFRRLDTSAKDLDNSLRAVFLTSRPTHDPQDAKSAFQSDNRIVQRLAAQ